MIETDGLAADILGIELTPTVVRAVRLKRGDRKVLKAGECPVLAIGDVVTLDPSAIGPALDEVMYQLGVDDRTEHLAAVTIGPRRAGVGSGPALPTWLDRRARQLGEDMVSAGKLGIGFCPQRALDAAIMICEQANITVSRIDFAPIAAARILEPGIDTITLGSGRGWRARLRDDEVLEALESADVPSDEPLMVVSRDGDVEQVASLHGVSLASDAKSLLAKKPGRFAPAVGSALGIVDGSSGNLLDGDIIRGRQVPRAFTPEVGGVETGEIAGSRTTVSLTRGQTGSEARAMIRQTGTAATAVTAPGEDSLGADEVTGGVDQTEAEEVESEQLDADDKAPDEPTDLGSSDAVELEVDSPDVDEAAEKVDFDLDALDQTDGAGDDEDGDSQVEAADDSVEDAVDTVDVAESGLLFDADGVDGLDEVAAVDDDEPVALFDESVDEQRSVLGGDVKAPRLLDDYESPVPVGAGEFDAAADVEERAVLGFGYESDVMDRSDQSVHPDDPINSFSPEPGAESGLDRRISGRGLAFVVAALILFSLAIAVGILVTQG